MTFAVVRVRGGIRTSRDVKETLRLLRLTRQNHLVFVPEDASHRGMLQKVKDYVTWGEVDAETIAEVLALRGRLSGGRPLTDEAVRARTEFKSTRELAAALAESRAAISRLGGIKPVIRLHPPRGGYEGTKRPFRDGGSLGYRGRDICSLVRSMLGPLPESRRGKPSSAGGGGAARERSGEGASGGG